MKRLTNILMLLLAMSMSLSAVVADEVDVVAEAEATADDDDTEVEVEAMLTGEGAEMRLLQLRRAIERAVLHGNEVIDRLEAKDASGNITAELGAIVTQLEGLTVEVDAAIEALDENTREEAVETFLAIKSDAKALIKEFREQVKNYLDENDKAELRRKLDEIDKEALAEYEQRIKAARCEFNAVRVEALLRLMGAADADLVAQVRACEVNAEETIKKLRERFKNLQEEERDAAEARLREEAARKRVARSEQIENFKAIAGAVAAVRLEERAEWLKEHNWTNASKRLEENALRLREKHELSDEDLAEIRAKFEERWENDGLRERVRVELRTRLREGDLEIRERLRLRLEDEKDDADRPDVCPDIAYGRCNAERLGMRCDPDSEADGFECDRVDNGCYGVCRKDISGGDRVCPTVMYGRCNAERVGMKCDVHGDEADGYECDRVEDACYGLCRADDDDSLEVETRINAEVGG